VFSWRVQNNRNLNNFVVPSAPEEEEEEDWRKRRVCREDRNVSNKR